MITFNETRHLETLKCYYNEPLDVFVFQCAGKKITVQYATPDQIASIFHKARVKDDTLPRSGREKTYAEMVAAVINGTDQVNYLWSPDVDVFFAACEKLVQSRIGRQTMPNFNEGETPMIILEKRIDRTGRHERPMNFREASNLPALAKGVTSLSANRFVPLARQDTIFSTLQSYGLDPYINKMRNVVCPVPTMQDGAAILQDIYTKFGLRGSVVITYEGLTKVYFDPAVKPDSAPAIAYAKATGLPPPNPRRYLA
jgi:hypothetical protein